MQITFRVDASLQMGTGHVMRCLTLAQALRDRGADCRFLCREHPGHLLQRIRDLGFEGVALPLGSDSSDLDEDVSQVAHAAWLGTNWQSDADQTMAALGEDCPDWLVVDHYALDHRWESKLRPHCGKIMVIDDLADRNHDCDLLLDQNLVTDLEHRYDLRLPISCARLLGPSYALLQPQYAELHPRTPPRMGPIERILVFFGGVDQYNLTGRAIAAFLSLNRPDITMDVVLSSASPYADDVRHQVQGHHNLVLHDSLPSLAPLMVKADLAIGAGGATSWERCCLGLPSLVVTLAENQRAIAAELDHQGLVRWLGDQTAVTGLALKQALQKALADNSLSDWSSGCRGVVDGLGTERVAAILTLGRDTQLTARPACLADEALLLQWANDPLVRQNSFHPNPIAPATHRAWFYPRLRHPETCQIYIVETEAGLPIGQVRFEWRDEAWEKGAWEINYSLAAVSRNQGLGAKLLQKAMQIFRESQAGTLVFGQVKSSNLPSQKVFEHSGFTGMSGGGGDKMVYSCML